MTTPWIESRKDIFVRDIIRDCINAQLYFERIKKSCSSNSSLPYENIALWVGTETKKGPLWHLKDQCHKLFRLRQHAANPYELLFDWTIGSIFHESMKLKEDAYQVCSYKPILESQVSVHKGNKELSQILKEYFILIEKAKKNISVALKNIDDLFSRSFYHLRMMLPLYANNMPLLRYLLDDADNIESVLGKGSLDQILVSMYGETRSKAYVVAAEHCIRNGWYKAAQQYLREILRADPLYSRSCELMEEASTKLNQTQ